jgi:cystathionine gamma-synthase
LAERPPSLATVAIHAGTGLDSKARPIAPAVHLSAVSWFESADDLDRSLDGEDFVYQRINGQNPALLEQALAALEGAEDCATFGSGMAALRAVFEAQALSAGDRVVVPADGYGATRALYKELCSTRGVELCAVPLCAPDAPARLFALAPRFVLAESITNPLLGVADLPALADACRRVGAKLAVDATFASPILQRPLELGATYAVQSTTKWINGHSDATGGAVSGSREEVAGIKKARVLTGAILGPFEAWLTLRGVRTLPLRVRQHCENAAQVAEALGGRSDLVERVRYPGLPDDPGHEVAERVLQGGFGGLVAFELRGADRAGCFRFLEALRLCRPAPSLGDVSTFVMHAASASARRLTPEERATAGISEALIRVSVGLEDPGEVAEDLLRAAGEAASR